VLSIIYPKGKTTKMVTDKALHDLSYGNILKAVIAWIDLVTADC
jgi:pyruvoyl-dependent arginine decarboxylase (PvlArgDC)